MKNKKLLRSFATASLLIGLVAPAYSLEGDVKSSFMIRNDGFIKTVKAEVTSVTGNIINAVTRFKDKAMNLVITTNGNTAFWVNNSATGTIADIKAGDKIKVAGAVTSNSSTTASVTATKVKDVTSTKNWKVKYGVVNSVNAANNTFVLRSNNNEFTFVRTSATTTVRLMNGTVTTVGNLPLEAAVVVTGFLENGPEGQILNAHSVIGTAKDDNKKDKDNWKNDTRGKNNNSRDRHSFFKDGYKNGLYFGFSLR